MDELTKAQWHPAPEFGSNAFVAAGAWCPACKEHGCMFHFGPDKHQCENCMKMLNDSEYERLIKKNPPR